MIFTFYFTFLCHVCPNYPLTGLTTATAPSDRQMAIVASRTVYSVACAGTTFTTLTMLTRPISQFMMTSSNLTFSASLALCVGYTPVTGEFPSQRAVTRSFDFFYLGLNKRLSKQSWGWWFETPSCSLWRHCNVVADFTLSSTRNYSLQSPIHFRNYKTWTESANLFLCYVVQTHSFGLLLKTSFTPASS